MEGALTGMGFTWEKAKIKNDLGYLCDIYHLTGTTKDGRFKPTKPSVVFTHGLGGDSREWLGVTDLFHEGKLPQAMQLAHRGFDVWMGNNSGTYFCYQHETLTINDPEFWDVDWVDFGVSDTKAQIEHIQQFNGGAKVAYVGHSQGTTQAFAALAKLPEWYDQNVNFMALYGPCTIMTTKYVAMTYTKEVIEWLEANNLYVLGGPYWSTHDRALIEQSAPLALKLSLGLFDTLKNFTLKSIAHYSQGGMSLRFQEYIDNWFDLPEDKPKHSELLDIGKVSDINVGLFVGLFDDTCPTSHAVDIYQNMGDKVVTYYKVCPWQGHSLWGAAAGEWFIDDLDRLLQTNMERKSTQFLE